MLPVSTKMLLLLLLLLPPSTTCFEWPSLSSVKSASICLSESKAFDPIQFVCVICPQGSKPTSNGLECECNDDHRLVSNPSGLDPECEKCPKGHRSTRDRLECIGCPRFAGKLCRCLDPNAILIERNLTSGAKLREISCQRCPKGSRPDKMRRFCVSCNDTPPLIVNNEANKNESRGECCPLASIVSGVCGSRLSGEIKLASLKQMSEVEFVDAGLVVASAHFRRHAPIGIALCQNNRNASACQLLANLCTLSLHKTSQPTCSIVYDLSLRERRKEVPHLFFSERLSSTVIRDRDITTVYKPNSRLDIRMAEYNWNGKFVGIRSMDSIFLQQLCNGSRFDLERAFQFGTRFRIKCKLPLSHLQNRGLDRMPRFYDLYMPFGFDEEQQNNDESIEDDKLFAVPIRLLNLNDDNKGSDRTRWELTTRFFLLDALSGRDDSDPTKPQVIRYLQQMHINVEMVSTRGDWSAAGRIYPPLVSLSYASIVPEESEKSEIDFEFSIDYEMSMTETQRDLEIALGVISAFVVLWALLKTWTWARRNGKLTIDPGTAAKFVAETCGSLAHIFLIVIALMALYVFVFYKFQSHLLVMLPSKQQENLFKVFVIIIFLLKSVHITHLILSQMSVDIFLVDWERPPPSSPSSSVSIWRTHLVANEWNELQTMRKIHVSLQLILVLLLLKVLRLEHLATADTNANLLDSQADLEALEQSYTCRLALAILVYLGLALVQGVFWCGFYSGFVEDKLEQFVDMCSLCNISVFVMEHANFGYYVHGRSAHGFADTNLATLMWQLQREADDACGHRGLVAGSDQQTFVMNLPSRVGLYYSKVVSPSWQQVSKLRMTAGGEGVQVAEKMAEAYDTMNRFITRFLDHALKDLDFEVRQRLLLEKIFDLEFQDLTLLDKGVFFEDPTFSFVNVLLYGHELSLTLFDLMLFCFADLLFSDFIAAAIITFFVTKIISHVRYVGGKWNLAKKTLIDKRFLI